MPSIITDIANVTLQPTQPFNYSEVAHYFKYGGGAVQQQQAKRRTGGRQLFCDIQLKFCALPSQRTQLLVVLLELHRISVVAAAEFLGGTLRDSVLCKYSASVLLESTLGPSQAASEFHAATFQTALLVVGLLFFFGHGSSHKVTCDPWAARRCQAPPSLLLPPSLSRPSPRACSSPAAAALPSWRMPC